MVDWESVADLYEWDRRCGEPLRGAWRKTVKKIVRPCEVPRNSLVGPSWKFEFLVYGFGAGRSVEKRVTPASLRDFTIFQKFRGKDFRWPQVLEPKARIKHVVSGPSATLFQKNKDNKWCKGANESH